MSVALIVFVSPSAKFHFLTHFVTSLFIHIIHLYYTEVDDMNLLDKSQVFGVTSAHLLVLLHFVDVLKFAMMSFVALGNCYIFCDKLHQMFKPSEDRDAVIYTKETTAD